MNNRIVLFVTHRVCCSQENENKKLFSKYFQRSLSTHFASGMKKNEHGRVFQWTEKIKIKARLRLLQRWQQTRSRLAMNRLRPDRVRPRSEERRGGKECRSR